MYLTNSLEQAHEYSGLLLFARELAREGLEAGEAKQDHPVMVVFGNPPYSGHSANKGQWIQKLLRGEDAITGESAENYFEVDGSPLRERNAKWLNDDYVKFIRFAQWRIEHTGHGVLAFIINHGYLDNPTFRGIRQSLMAAFNDIYILDLHGNTKKAEKSPDGTADKNVFDIQQGVCIGIFVRKKRGNHRKAANVYHAELWGTREGVAWEGDELKLIGGKYEWLYGHDVTTVKWAKLDPDTPNYFFRPLDKAYYVEYSEGWSIPHIMPKHSLGIVTARDSLTIAWTEEEIRRRGHDFLARTTEDARRTYGLGKDVRDWKVGLAQADLSSQRNLEDKLRPISYRPFDVRQTFYTGKTRGFMCMPRPDVMGHMLQEN